MKVLIGASGTRGDIQPFVALAYAVQSAGHKPILAAPVTVRRLAEDYDIELIPLADPAENVIFNRDFQAVFTSHHRGFRRLIAIMKYVRRQPKAPPVWTSDTRSLVPDDIDLVVHRFGFPALEVAQKLNVPTVEAFLQPQFVPTRKFAHPKVAFRIPRALNYSSYMVANTLTLRNAINILGKISVAGSFRRREQVESRNRSVQVASVSAATMQAFSKSILPAEPEYPESVHTTGFWFLPTHPDWRPSEGLRNFIESGDVPIYIGFGSIVGLDPRRTSRLVMEAVRRAGVRAVIATGWGGLECGSPNEDVFVLDEAPHDWLFPRMAAIVHHGGAGTTGAALAAGRPQVVCPFGGDQPAHARRMHTMGVATRPLPQHRLTTEKLTHAIRAAVTDQTLASRAEHFGTVVADEDGAATAVKILETLI